MRIDLKLKPLDLT